MDEKKETNDKGSCCGTSGCHHGRCCAGRTALALVLLLIGGLIGFGIGHCHSSRWACNYAVNCPEMMGHPPITK